MVGSMVSHYTILERLGGGGMGVVYKARDVKLGRTVALKFLPPDLTRDADARERFIHEAQAASGLDHPNICNIHEIDETPDSRTFICMAFYDGASLKTEIDQGHLDIGRALDVAVQIASGLGRAHEAGMIHRDIKPANIMVTSRGEVKIIDFGLAKLAGQTTLTGKMHLLGTAAYMSPEQVRGEVVDHRTDIWSFGMTLYEMISGEHPFRCENREATFYSILAKDPRPLAELRDDVPAALDRLIRCCLEKEPADRFQSMTPVREELERIRAQWSPLKPHRRRRTPLPRLRLRRSVRKWRVPATLGLIITGAGVSWIVLLGWPGGSSFASTKHLAVLPFTNVGNDSSKQAFCDGLWETVTCKLTQLEQFDRSLSVVPTSEVRKDSIESASEARRKFGVTLVFSPSIQWEGDSLLLLTLNLVDASTLRQVRSFLLTERTSNVSSLHLPVISKMAEMLNMELHPVARHALAAGETELPGAYEHYLKGCGYLHRSDKAENIDAAIEHFGLAIGEDSMYALAYSGLGEAYWRKYKATKDVRLVDPALQNCERALAIDQELPQAHMTMGLVRAGTGQYDAALNEFHRALALDSVSSDTYREIARVYSALGEKEKAEATLKRAISLRPDDWAAYSALGFFYSGQGRYDDAIVQYTRVVELTPDNAKGYNNLGALYFLVGKWEEARGAWERSLAIAPRGSVCSNLGTLYFHLGRYADASEMFRAALNFSAMDYKIWGNLAASLYWTPGKRSEARESYRKAAELAELQLQVNLHDEDVLISLSSYYASLGDRSRTLGLLQNLCSRAPTDPGMMARIADAYELLGERDSAVAWISRAIGDGYSLRMLQAEPGMKALREDTRVKSLLNDIHG
jgi:serine/threonine protein kinase/tetratricopeptide (TPR) repeat protein